MNSPVTIFVYGTLMRHQSNHPMLDGATFVSPARTAPEFTLWHLGEYPAMTSGGHTAIRGEVYSVDADLLARLDHFEGVPTLYERVLVDLVDAAPAFAYLMKADTLQGRPRRRPLDSGDWRRPHGGS